MMGARTGRVLLFAAALTLRAVAEPVAGEPAEPSDAVEPPDPAVPSEDLSRARVAFRLGSSLAKQGQWVDALAAFQQSARLQPHPITTYNVAYCERALGRYARASLRFAEALDPSPALEGAALPPDLAREAATYLDEVRQRVVHVEVTLSPRDLTLRVDGSALEAVPSTGKALVFVVGERDLVARPSSAAAFEVWLDPGAHVFVASGAGDQRTVESRTFAAGESAALRLSVHSAPPVPAPPAKADHPGVEASPNRTPAYVAFGVGAVGFVGGAVFAGLSLAEKRSLDADGECVSRQCPPGYAEREERMVRFADFATVGLVTGLVGSGVGTYLYLTAKPPKARTARITPWLSGGMAGLRGRF